MNLSPMYGFVTITDHLENVGLLSYTDLPNTETFHHTSIPHLSVSPMISSEESLRIQASRLW